MTAPLFLLCLAAVIVVAGAVHLIWSDWKVNGRG